MRNTDNLIAWSFLQAYPFVAWVLFFIGFRETALDRLLTRRSYESFWIIPSYFEIEILGKTYTIVTPQRVKMKAPNSLNKL